MATYVGRDAAVKLGTVTISELTDWSIDVTADVIRADTFGTTWARKHGLAATDWSATVNGLVDLTDTTGQDVCWNAVVSGTLVTTLRFYIDDTTYYTPDTDTDADAGCYITSFSPGTAQGDVARFSMTVEGTGPIYSTS